MWSFLELGFFFFLQISLEGIETWVDRTKTETLLLLNNWTLKVRYSTYSPLALDFDKVFLISR